MEKHLPDHSSGFGVKIGVVYGEMDTTCLKSLRSAFCPLPTRTIPLLTFEGRVTVSNAISREDQDSLEVLELP
jgi:hypothetical protein